MRLQPLADLLDNAVRQPDVQPLIHPLRGVDEPRATYQPIRQFRRPFPKPPAPAAGRLSAAFLFPLCQYSTVGGSLAIASLRPFRAYRHTEIFKTNLALFKSANCLLNIALL